MKKFYEESIKSEDFFSEMNSAGLTQMLTDLSKAIEIYRSIPATSCSSERPFSALRRTKTYLRNTTGQDQLTNFALINVERIQQQSESRKF